ncbi:hypothetical protein ACKC9G_17100 [Pokkaliibacter sp. CJK22405]|uniref:hypothetical protein n=1 Tax=Pokkaliibacter sp. CJK22405 TaxID=3384615 RepID=UPI003984B30B
MSLTIKALDLAHPLHQAADATTAPTIDHGPLEERLQAMRLAPPQSGSLQQAMHHHLHHHWQHRQQVNHDWQDQSPYAQQRRDSLSKLTGGKNIAAQYGISIAKPMDAETLMRGRELRTGNSADAQYTRSAPNGGFTEECMKRYVKAGGQRSDHVVFFNSPNAVRQMMSMLGNKFTSPQPKALGHGLVALRLATEEQADLADNFVAMMGARPSPYRVAEAELRPTPIAADPTVNTHRLLAKLRGEGSDVKSPIQRLRDIPDNHGHAALAHTAASAVELLVNKLESEPLHRRHQHNPILANGLKALTQIAEQLPSLHGDSHSFCAGYRVLMEELQVCLAATRPYTPMDYRQAASSHLAAETLPKGLPPAIMHLTTSGMNAITQAFELASRMTSKHGVDYARTPAGDETPVYFEVDLPRRFIARGAESNSLFATLNLSQPGGEGLHKAGWCVDDVIAATDKRLQQQNGDEPLCLILDSTVEKPGDMSKLTGHFGEAIAAGKLKILACKSYQKFASLGSSKVMAGGIGLITNNDPYGQVMHKMLNQTEQESGLHNNPETQLLSHMMQLPQHEMALIDKACDNARFVSEHFFHGKDGHSKLAGHDSHLPFITFKSEQGEEKLNHFSASLIAGEQTEHSAQAKEQLSPALIPTRSSFGFPETTKSTMFAVDNNKMLMRLAFGQETQAELTERFYLPSRLMHEEGSQFSVNQATTLINELTAEALKQQNLSGSGQSLAQKLRQIAQAERPMLTEKQRLTASPEQLQLSQGRDEGLYSLNKIASVLNHTAEQLLAATDLLDNPCSGPDREPLETALHGMIHSGMSGVSTPVRQRILDLQTALHLSDIKHAQSDVEADHALQQLGSDLSLYPNLPLSLNKLHELPDAVFKRADASQQEQLITSLFNPLDHESQLRLVEGLITGRQHPELVSKLLDTLSEKPVSAGAPSDRTQSHNLNSLLIRQRLSTSAE